MRILAQIPSNLGTKIGGVGLGPFSNVIDAADGLKRVTNVISAIIGVMTVVAGIWFVLNILIAGIQWVGASGDKNSLEQAQKRITSALVGLIIVVAGWTILSLVGKFLGYDILITNPDAVIKSISP